MTTWASRRCTTGCIEGGARKTAACPQPTGRLRRIGRKRVRPRSRNTWRVRRVVARMIGNNVAVHGEGFMDKKRLNLGPTLLMGALAAAPVTAHHSPAKYETGKSVQIVGTVTKYEW